MPNQVLRCIRDCQLTNDQGLEEFYEDDPGHNLYEVTEERAAQLLAHADYFEAAPPDAVATTSYVGADSGRRTRVDTEHPPRFGGYTPPASSSFGGGGNGEETGSGE